MLAPAYPQSGEGIRPAVESALLAARTRCGQWFVREATAGYLSCDPRKAATTVDHERRSPMTSQRVVTWSVQCLKVAAIWCLQRSTARKSFSKPTRLIRTSSFSICTCPILTALASLRSSVARQSLPPPRSSHCRRARCRETANEKCQQGSQDALRSPSGCQTCGARSSAHYDRHLATSVAPHPNRADTSGIAQTLWASRLKAHQSPSQPFPAGRQLAREMQGICSTEGAPLRFHA